jgi:penicillin amidase
MLSTGAKFSVSDFEKMQQDVTSVPARRFQAVVRKWTPPPELAGIVQEVLAWDSRMSRDSRAALVYEEWTNHLPEAIFGAALGRRVNLGRVLAVLEKEPNAQALSDSLSAALEDIGRRMGPDRSKWRWGRLHRMTFQHPLGEESFNRGIERPGDANTVNATSGAGFQQTNGASYREVLDLADWDRSMMTNVPGESGDPASPHYDDLLVGWDKGIYHPMPFSRAAVEAATTERILLVP